MSLMHHFTYVIAARDFLGLHDPDVAEMWRNTAPNLAFEHPFLLNIMIAIAALHVTKVQPDRADMADIHRTYFNAAISQHRHALQDLGPENAEAVCVSTVLIALPAFILLQTSEVACYYPPLQLFYLLGSNVPVFKQALPLIPMGSKIMSILTCSPDMMEFLQESDKEQYGIPFARFAEWRAHEENIDPESENVYSFALKFIGCALATIETSSLCASEIRRVLYSFPTLVPQLFVTRLKENNPRALVILAYFFCLCKAVDNVWWMRGIAEREVFGIQRLLPEEWQWTMSWPLTKLASYAQSSLPLM
jgi:hypothetical protein